MNANDRCLPSFPAGVPRTPAGAIDHEAVAREARRLRGEALGALIESLGRRLRTAVAAAVALLRLPGARGRTPC